MKSKDSSFALGHDEEPHDMPLFTAQAGGKDKANLRSISRDYMDAQPGSAGHILSSNVHPSAPHKTAHAPHKPAGHSIITTMSWGLSSFLLLFLLYLLSASTSSLRGDEPAMRPAVPAGPLLSSARGNDELAGIMQARAKLEDRNRRENYRQEMRLRKANQADFTEQYTRCSPNDAQKHLVSYPGAVCMDGTKPAYYLRRGSGSGSSKWVVFFEGGGWCYTLAACAQRARTDLGSSVSYPECLHRNKIRYYLHHDAKKNPLMYNWNVVYVKYCDGGSYAGDAEVQMETAQGQGRGRGRQLEGRDEEEEESRGQVFNTSTHREGRESAGGALLHFRGRANREGTIHHLLHTTAIGAATDIVLGGCSAGALGVFLGLDQMAAQIRAFNASQRAAIVGFADSGFFMAHTSDNKWKLRRSNGPPGVDLVNHEAIINGNMDFQNAMRSVFRFMNISAGANPQCVAALRTAGRPTSDCFFPQHLAPFVRTPLFAKQPKFDQWQIWHVVGKANNATLGGSSLLLRARVGGVGRMANLDL